MKYRFCLVILISLTLFLVACDREVKTAILLGHVPVDMSKISLTWEMPIFKPRQRIYYVLLSKEPIESPRLRLQVLKLDKKVPYYGITQAYGIDINRGPDKHQISDYFILHNAGSYVIRIFSHDNMEEPVAEAEFLVEAL